MKRLSRMLVVSSVIALGLTTLVAAQMMGGNQGHMMQNTDSTSQSLMLHKADSLSAQMSNHWNMMTGNYDKLDSQFQSMMKINDMSQLKAEMQKYHENMVQMRQQMMQQHNMCQMISNMMTQSGGMKGMHGQNGMHGTQGVMDTGQSNSQGDKREAGNK